MRQSFEFFVARRYLMAKRKQAVISVITVISVMGVAAGVMALIIALAINNGFRSTLQRNLVGATAHVTVLEKQPRRGIEDWPALVGRLRALPRVTSASPTLYGGVYLSGPVQGTGAVLKGVALGGGYDPPDFLTRLKSGSIDALRKDTNFPGIVLGARLSESSGMLLNSVVTVISPQGEMTPFGLRPSYHRFRVVGIFESGFFDLDSMWAFSTLENAQRVLAVGQVVNAVELKVDDLAAAPDVAREAERVAGAALGATHWMEQNRQILNALRMEKAVTVVTIGLIELVAALNILITLIMMVMEKSRDIAVLMSLGARHQQIRKIFMLQGVLIGVTGTAIGLVAGHVLSFLADRYRWIRLDEQVYSLSFVPFEPRPIDTLWVAAVAIAVSFVATLYPARAATRVAPAEALRYE